MQRRSVFKAAGLGGRFGRSPIRRFASRFQAAAVQEGWNPFVVMNNSRNPGQAVKMVSLEIGVRA